MANSIARRCVASYVLANCRGAKSQAMWGVVGCVFLVAGVSICKKNEELFGPAIERRCYAPLLAPTLRMVLRAVQ